MLVWLALAIALVSVLGSLLYGTLRGLEAFRAFKGLSRKVGASLDRITAASAEIETHLGAAADAGSRLERSLARLKASNARLNVLRSALDDVTSSVGRVTAVYPRK